MVYGGPVIVDHPLPSFTCQLKNTPEVVLVKHINVALLPWQSAWLVGFKVTLGHCADALPPMRKAIANSK
jgi:hypothetical protein